MRNAHVINRIPVYAQIRDHIRKEIAAGNRQPGGLFASERELESLYPACRATISKAVSSLVAEGVLYRIQGKGTFVAGPGAGKRQTGNIGLIPRWGRDWFPPLHPYLEIIGLVERELSDSNHCVVYQAYRDDFAKDGYLPPMVAERKVDGILLLGAMDPAFIWRIKDTGIPVVLIDNALPGGKVHAIAHDERGGARQVTAHLIRLGHRGIAYLSLPLRDHALHERLAGYKAALQDAGLPVREELVHEMDGKEGCVRAGALELLKRRDSWSALFGANDYVAAEAIKVLREKGFAIPQDLSVAGFDHDVSVLSGFTPTLTTVRPDRTRMSSLAVARLFDIIEGTEVPVETVLPVELVVGDSAVARTNGKEGSAHGSPFTAQSVGGSELAGVPNREPRSRERRNHARKERSR